MTEIDGKFFKSFKLLLFKPGQLTLDYLNGLRKYRLYPFQLFIYINILYFFFVSLTYQNTFTTPLKVHLQATNFIHVNIAKKMVNNHLQETGQSMKEYAEQFDEKIDSQSKVLIFTMIPIFAFMFFILFLSKSHKGITGIVYATHFIVMVLSVLMLTTILIYIIGYVFSFFLTPVNSKNFYGDAVFSFVALLWLLIYLFLSLKRIYPDKMIIVFIKSLLLVVGFYYSIILYRALLFFTTYYSIH